MGGGGTGHKCQEEPPWRSGTRQKCSGDPRRGRPGWRIGDDAKEMTSIARGDLRFAICPRWQRRACGDARGAYRGKVDVVGVEGTGKDDWTEGGRRRDGHALAPYVGVHRGWSRRSRRAGGVGAGSDRSGQSHVQWKGAQGQKSPPAEWTEFRGCSRAWAWPPFFRSNLWSPLPDQVLQVALVPTRRYGRCSCFPAQR